MTHARLWTLMVCTLVVSACRTTPPPPPPSQCATAALGVNRARCCLNKLVAEARAERDVVRLNCLVERRSELDALTGPQATVAAARAIHLRGLGCIGTRSIHPEECPAD